MLVRWATLVAWFSSAWVAALLAGAQQNRTISGTVVDLGTGTPVPANTIVEFKVENINPSVLSTIVTNSGQFIVRNVPRTWSNGITAHVNVGRSPGYRGTTHAISGWYFVARILGAHGKRESAYLRNQPTALLC